MKDAVLVRVEKARITLHYSEWDAKPAFFCPCGEGASHRAELSDTKWGSWICSRDPLRCDRLEEKYLLWTGACCQGKFTMTGVLFNYSK